MTDVNASPPTKKARFLYIKQKGVGSSTAFQIEFPKSYSSLLDVVKQKFKGNLIVRALYDEEGNIIKSIDKIKTGSMIYVSTKSTMTSTSAATTRRTIQNLPPKRDMSAQIPCQRDKWKTDSKPVKLPNTPFTSRQTKRSRTPQKKGSPTKKANSSDSKENIVLTDILNAEEEDEEAPPLHQSSSTSLRSDTTPEMRTRKRPKINLKKSEHLSFEVRDVERFNRELSSQQNNANNTNGASSPNTIVSITTSTAEELSIPDPSAYTPPKLHKRRTSESNQMPVTDFLPPDDCKLKLRNNLYPPEAKSPNGTSRLMTPPKASSPSPRKAPLPPSSPTNNMNNTGSLTNASLTKSFNTRSVRTKDAEGDFDPAVLISHKRSSSKTDDFKPSHSNFDRRRHLQNAINESLSSPEKVIINDKNNKNANLKSIESAIEALTYLSSKSDMFPKQANLESDIDDDDFYDSGQFDSSKESGIKPELKLFNPNKAAPITNNSDVNASIINNNNNLLDMINKNKNNQNNNFTKNDSLDAFKDSEDSELFSSSTEEELNLPKTGIQLNTNPNNINNINNNNNTLQLRPITKENMIRIQKTEVAPMSSPDNLDQFMESDDDFSSIGSANDANDSAKTTPKPFQSDDEADYSESDSYDDDEYNDNENIDLQNTASSHDLENFRDGDEMFSAPIPSIVRRRSNIIRNISDLSYSTIKRAAVSVAHQRSNSRSTYRIPQQPFLDPFSSLNSTLTPKSCKPVPRIPKKPNVPSVNQRPTSLNQKRTNRFEMKLNILMADSILDEDEYLFHLVDTAVDHKPQTALGLSPDILPSNLLPLMERQQASAWIAHGCLVACLQGFPDTDQELYMYDEMINKSRKILRKHRFSTQNVGSDFRLNVAVVGPRNSGKSTFLRILTDQLIADLVVSGVWRNTFVFMLNMENIALSLSNDISRFYVTMVHATIKHLAWHRPAMQAHFRTLIRFFDSVLTRRHLRRLPKEMIEKYPDLSNSLMTIGGILFILWNTPTAFHQFLAATLMLPKLIANALNFSKTLFVVDHFDSAHIFVQPNPHFRETTEGIWLTQIVQTSFMSSTNFIIASENTKRFYEATMQRVGFDIVETTDIIDSAYINNLEELFSVRIGSIEESQQEQQQQQQQHLQQQMKEMEEPLVLTPDLCGGSPAFLKLWNDINTAADEMADCRIEEYVLALNNATKIFLETVFVDENGAKVNFDVKSVRRMTKKPKK